MSSSAGAALGQPARLAVAGDGVVAVADREGRVAFRQWPDGGTTVVRAHQNAGPLGTVGGDVASSGGWETTVTRWDPRHAVARWEVRPFDGRVTALAGRGDDLLVAGADRATQDRPASAGTASPDRVALGPAAVVRLDRDGRAVERQDLGLSVISDLVACPTWFAALEAGRAGRVVVVGGRDGGAPLVTAGQVTAIAGAEDELVVAGRQAIEWFDVAGSRRRGRLDRTSDATVLAVVRAGDHIVGITADGLLTWPGEQLEPCRPVAIASRGDTCLVLHADWTLEERTSDGAVRLRTCIT